MKNINEAIQILDDVNRDYRRDCYTKSRGIIGEWRYRTFTTNLEKLKRDPDDIESLLNIFDLCDAMRSSRLREYIFNATWQILELTQIPKPRLAPIDAKATAQFAARNYPIACTMFPRLASEELYATSRQESKFARAERTYQRETMIRAEVKRRRNELQLRRQVEPESSCFSFLRRIFGR